jgi:hypothetical protein
MQTFLPFRNFQESASCLDRARLGKQRVETIQILKALSDPSYGWQNHPATNMWRGCELSLVDYGLTICAEWISRGYKDTCFEKIKDLSSVFDSHGIPWWLGDERLHSSHQAMLFKKDPEFYMDFGAQYEKIDNYWWPTDHDPLSS